MSAARYALGVLVAAAMTAATVALSRLPWTAERSSDAELRFAWRFRSERVTACRTRTPEELARVPAHMRQETVCEPRLIPYRLEVTVDGAQVADDTARPRGARADRPLSVFRRVVVSPGTHRVRVVFGPLEPGGPSPPLVLDTSLALPERRVVIVTASEQTWQFAVATRLPQP